MAAHSDRFESLTLISTTAGAGLLPLIPPPAGAFTLGGLYQIDDSGVGCDCCDAAKTFLTTSVKSQMDNSLLALFPAKYLDASVIDPTNGAVVERRKLVKRSMVVRNKNSVPPRVDGVLRQVTAALTHQITHQKMQQIRGAGVNVLVIVGKQDMILSWRESLRLYEGYHAKLLLFHDAGHGVNEQYPEQVNAAIEANIDAGISDAKARVALSKL